MNPKIKNEPAGQFVASLMQEFHKRLQQIVHQRTHRLRLTASQTKKEGKENPHKCLAVGRVSEGKDINRTHTHTSHTQRRESSPEHVRPLVVLYVRPTHHILPPSCCECIGNRERRLMPVVVASVSATDTHVLPPSCWV